MNRALILTAAKLAAAVLAEKKDSPAAALAAGVLREIVAGVKAQPVTPADVQAAIAMYLSPEDVAAHFDAAFDELDALEAEAKASLARRDAQREEG